MQQLLGVLSQKVMNWFISVKISNYTMRLKPCLARNIKPIVLQLLSVGYSGLTQDIIIILETQGWQKIVDEQESVSEPLDQIQAVARVGNKFKTPLESAGVNIDELCTEFKDILDHSTQFIFIYPQLSRSLVEDISLT